MALKDLPSDAQPREKLLARGPGALSDAELLALLLRTGMAGKGVLQLAARVAGRRHRRGLAASAGCCTPAPTI